MIWRVGYHKPCGTALLKTRTPVGAPAYSRDTFLISGANPKPLTRLEFLCNTCQKQVPMRDIELREDHMRYLLFAGYTFYPGGGWEDFQGGFETEADARAAMKIARKHNDWAHCMDIQEMRMLADEEQKTANMPGMGDPRTDA